MHTCVGQQNDASMPCVCECHALKKEQPSNQTPCRGATPILTPNVNLPFSGCKPLPLISTLCPSNSDPTGYRISVLSIPGDTTSSLSVPLLGNPDRTQLAPPSICIPLLSASDFAKSASPSQPLLLLGTPGTTHLVTPRTTLSISFSNPTHLAPPISKSPLLNTSSSTHNAPPHSLFQFSVPTPVAPLTSTAAHSGYGAVTSSGKPLITVLPSMMLSNPTTAPLTSVNKRGIDDAIECSSSDWH